MYPAKLSFTRKSTKGRPDVGAVVHAHPFHVVLLSATGRKLETFNPSSISFRGGVPVLGSQLIYKLEDGREIAETLGNGKAVILKNHGAVTIGRTVAEAVVTMYQLGARRLCARRRR